MLGTYSSWRSGRVLKELKIRRSDLVLSTKVFFGVRCVSYRLRLFDRVLTTSSKGPNATGLSRKQYVPGFTHVRVLTTLEASSRAFMSRSNVSRRPMSTFTLPTDPTQVSRWKKLFVRSIIASTLVLRTTGLRLSGAHVRLKKLSVRLSLSRVLFYLTMIRCGRQARSHRSHCRASSAQVCLSPDFYSIRSHASIAYSTVNDQKANMRTY